MSIILVPCIKFLINLVIACITINIAIIILAFAAYGLYVILGGFIIYNSIPDEEDSDENE